MAATEMAKKFFNRKGYPTNQSLDFVGVISLKALRRFQAVMANSITVVIVYHNRKERAL